MCDGVMNLFQPTGGGSGGPGEGTSPAGKLLMLSSAMKAIGGMFEGKQAADYYKYQQAQAVADAEAERQLGEVKADTVRRAGAVTKAAAMGAQGGSGSSVDSGTARAVREYIDRTSEYDALTELYGGRRRAASMLAGAQGYGAQASMARTAGMAAAGRSLLSGAGAADEIKQSTNRWIRKTVTDDDIRKAVTTDFSPRDSYADF